MKSFAFYILDYHNKTKKNTGNNYSIERRSRQNL